jgi:Phosphotransferase enzyme family
MALSPRGQPAAVGVRQPYERISPQVRAWVEDQLEAPIGLATTQVGGMSPGSAARLRTVDGRHAFVKAVGVDANPMTPELFRHEIEILSRLPPAPYRPRVLGSYDDGVWVALLLEDIDGCHPDLADPVESEAVWSMVATQSRELTPPPAGLTVATLADNARRWAEGWATMATDPARALPSWVSARIDELSARIDSLPGRLPADSLCHWDVRDDNLLLRPDGSPVIVDWGMSRLGPAWADLVLLSVAWAEQPELDGRLDEIDADPDTVTDLLLGLGGWLALRSSQEPPPGLPTLPAFQQREARRVLTLARRRLRKEHA